MLLEIAIGDAYGVGFEFCEQEFIIQHNHGTSYLEHANHPGLYPGMYTDDTQMSLAIAEAMLSEEEWTRQNIASRFVEVFKRDERRGYAGGFYKFLMNINSGEEFLANIMPTSERSGAAMRAGVIGLYPDLMTVKDRSETQAAITHCTKNGINSSIAASCMAWFFHHAKGDKQELALWLNEQVPGYDWHVPHKGPVSLSGIDCVRAAVTTIIENSTLTGILRQGVSYSGDVDTVLAIAMAAACGDPKQIIHDFPNALVDNLENGTYGKDYITNLDKQLNAMFKS